MVGMIVTCAACGTAYEPEPAAIRAGTWKRCPHCTETRPADLTVTTCQECGRELRNTTRRLCARCMGILL